MVLQKHKLTFTDTNEVHEAVITKGLIAPWDILKGFMDTRFNNAMYDGYKPKDEPPFIYEITEVEVSEALPENP